MNRLLCILFFVFVVAIGAGLRPIMAAETAVYTWDALTDVQTIETDTIDLEKLNREDRSRGDQGLAPRFAHRFDVIISTESNGNWVTDPQTGDLIWRLKISSADALSLNFGFSDYQMPKGGALTIYDQLGREVALFTDQHPSDQLWTPMITGSKATLVVRIPAETRNQLALTLKQINHGYKTLESALSGSCQVDVICSEGDTWRDEIQSVAFYTIDGIETCSGSLVNNSAEDLTPYFLTANHCGVNYFNDDSVVVYWNYQNSTCRAVGSAENGGLGDGSRAQYTSGATWLSSHEATDMTLLRLNQSLDSSFNLYWAGWSRSFDNPQSAVGIHHPNIEEKRISIENDSLWATSFGDSMESISGSHWRVSDWDQGSTEPGSSGSPLFNENHALIGWLTGGPAACGVNEADWYGRFAVAWKGGGSAETQLSKWLDPLNSEVMTLQGRFEAKIPHDVIDHAKKVVINNTPFQSTLDWVDATDGTNDPMGSCVGETGDHTVWYQFMPTQAGTISAEMTSDQAASMETVIWQRSETGELTEVACGNSAALAANETYYIEWIATTPVTTPSENTLSLSFTPSNGCATSNEPITLLTPSGVLREGTATMIWTADPNATDYHLQLSADVDFNQIISDHETKALELTLSLADNTYYWRVQPINRNSGCDLPLAWSSVGQFEIDSDDIYEPNNVSNEATPLEINQTVTMSLTITDVDWITFTLTESTRIRVATFDVGAGPQDTVIELLDASLFPMATDDDGGGDTYSLIETCLSAGTYFALIRPYSERIIPMYGFRLESIADNNCVAPVVDVYEEDDSAETASPITAGEVQTHSLPYGDSDWVTFTLTETTSIQLETFDIGAGPQDTVLELFDASLALLITNDDGGIEGYSLIETCLPAGTYFAHIQPFSGIVTAYGLRLETIPFSACSGTFTDVYEEDNSAETASPISFGEVQNHSLPYGDSDWVTFTLTVTTLFHLETFDVAAGDQDTVIELFDAALSPLTINDDGGEGTYSLIESCLPAGTYFAHIRPYSGGNIPIYGLRLDSISVSACSDNQVDEYEEDNSAETASPITFGEIQTHSLPSSDLDWVTFTLTETTLIHLETFDVGAGPQNTVLELFDASLSLIATDYDWGMEYYSLITWCLPAGTYFALVRPYSEMIPTYGLRLESINDNSCVSPVGDEYEEDNSAETASPITFGEVQTHSMPYADSDWVTFTLTEADFIHLATFNVGAGPQDTVIELFDASLSPILTDDDGGGDTYSLIASCLPAGTYFALVRPFGQAAIPIYGLRLDSIADSTCSEPFVDEYEEDAGDNSVETASPISLGEVQIHHLSIDDQDWISFTLTETVYITLSTFGDSGTTQDTLLQLYDSTGRLLRRDDDGGGNGYSQIDLCLNSGTYYAQATAYKPSITVINNYGVALEGTSGCMPTSVQLVRQAISYHSDWVFLLAFLTLFTLTHFVRFFHQKVD